MNIISQWKFTINPAGTPVVILNYGDELLEEPTFTLRRGLEVIPIPEGVPVLRPTLADVYEFHLPIVNAAASDAEARRDMLLQFSDRYDSQAPFVLRWEIKDLTDRYSEFSSAFCHSPSIRRMVDNVEGGWLLTLPITAVGMTKTLL
jgi:hypothetical protein